MTPPSETARTRLLDAALRLIRERGYAATSVDELCRAAGVTKGSFFHHFESKEALALAAIGRWNETTGALFAGAPYQRVEDPRDRLLAHLDFRAALVRGGLPDLTCLLGTLVQETFASHPALRAACGAGIEAHAQTLLPTIDAARWRYAPDADWTAGSLARHTQVVLQGAFVLAKALDDPAVVLDAIAQLRRHVELLLPRPTEGRRASGSSPASSSAAPPSRRSASASGRSAPGSRRSCAFARAPSRSPPTVCRPASRTGSWTRASWSAAHASWSPTGAYDRRRARRPRPLARRPGPGERPPAVRGAGRGRAGRHGDRTDLLVARLRHAHRPLRHRLDGDRGGARPGARLTEAGPAP